MPRSTGAGRRRRESRPLLVHLITRWILGGAQENTLLSAEGTARAGGWRVGIVAGPGAGPEGALRPPDPASGCALEIDPCLVRAVSPIRDSLALVSLVRRLRRWRPALVHTHSAKGGVLGRLAARLAGVPSVVHSVHGPFVYGTLHPVGARLMSWIERALAPGTDVWVTVSERLARDLVRRRIAPASRVRVVYSGMEEAAYRPTAGARARWATRLGLDPGVPWFVHVGRLHRLKGQEFVLEALARVRRRKPSAVAILVGDGAYRAALAARAEALGMADAVRWAGRLTPHDTADVMAAGDVLVQTSLREGIPRVLVQGQLAGLRAVAFDLDGAREALGGAARLVPPADTVALAWAMVAALEDRSVGDGCTGLRRRFEADAMVAALGAVYREASGRGRPVDPPEGRDLR